MPLKPTFADQLSLAEEKINLREWAGGMKQEMATAPQIRLGSIWFTTPFLLKIFIPLGILGALAGIYTAHWLRTLPLIQSFIAQYPGVGDFALPVTSGFPVWLRFGHWLNAFVMIFIIRSGLQILADHPRLYLNAGCTPGTEWFRLRGPIPQDREWSAKSDSVGLPGWLGLPGIRHSVGLARWWHFGFDSIWLLNGLAIYVLLFATDQWKRLIPVSWSVFPHAVSTAIQYLSLDFPPASGWLQYNGLQMLAYASVVFVISPLAMITGLIQAPAIAARLHLAAGWFNRQVGRTLHFGVLVAFLAFVAGHVVMVFATGALTNLNHMTRGTDDSTWIGAAIFLAIAAVTTLAWALASPVTLLYPRTIRHFGRFLIGWIYESLENLRPQANYQEKDISTFHWVNGTHPQSPEYLNQLANGFKDFRLSIGGEVENPVELPMTDLLRLPKVEQITSTYCIQGWSGIAKWGGVRLSEIMKIVRPKGNVQWAVFYSFGHGPGSKDGLYYDCHKIAHLSHPNTILAYEMNGRSLQEPHGAPLRLRNELELGYKQVKWVQRIEFVESFHHLGAGQGGFNEDHEYYGYRAPI